MTHTPQPDESTVQHDSDIRGYSTPPLHSQPPYLLTSSSGGGSVSFGRSKAMTVESGGSVGDSASAFIYRDASYGEASKVEAEIVIGFRNPPIYSEKYSLGLFQGSFTDHNFLAGIDYQAGEYYIDGTTRPATMPNDDERTVVRVTVDYDSGQTTVEQRGGVNESETVSKTVRQLQAGVSAENVNGENNVTRSNDIHFMRYNMEI